MWSTYRTDSLVVVLIIGHLNALLPLVFFFCLSDFTVFLYLQRLSCTISLFDRRYSHIWLPNNLYIKKSRNEAHLCVHERVPMHVWMLCVQLHKYVFGFLGAANNALKKDTKHLFE